VKGEALRRSGMLAGLLAGPFFLVSVGLNTRASLGLPSSAWLGNSWAASRFHGLAMAHRLAVPRTGRSPPPGIVGHIGGGVAVRVGIGFGVAAWRCSEREVTGLHAVPCHRTNAGPVRARGSLVQLARS
jgi:hypothetical protein